MSRKSKTRRRPATAAETFALRPGPNWALLAMSSLGIALTAAVVIPLLPRSVRTTYRI